MGAKLGQLHKFEHKQPNIVHYARHWRVLRCWDARYTSRPFADWFPVQPDPRPNGQQVLDPSTLPGREPVHVAVKLHAPEVRLELELGCGEGDISWERGKGGAAGVRFAQGCNDNVGR